jgi:hypothetical protein
LSSPKKIEIIHVRRKSKKVVVILPGFNQDGEALIKVLAPALAQTDILTYRLPRWGFDQAALVRELPIATATGYNHVIVYAESAGRLTWQPCCESGQGFASTMPCSMPAWEAGKMPTQVAC